MMKRSIQSASDIGPESPPRHRSGPRRRRGREGHGTQADARDGRADLARAVWSRRKWLAIVAFAVPFSAAVSLAKYLPNVYRSAATVLIEGQQVPATFVRPAVTSELETRIHTISEEILSRSRLGDIIARLDLYPDLRKRTSLEAVIERMRRDIDVKPKEISQPDGRGATTVAFTLSYTGRDPQTTARVTNTLASFYIEENRRNRERQATGTAQFLWSQLDEVKRQLDQQEARISDFKMRHIGELPQQLEANLATLEQLNAQLRLNSDKQIQISDRRALLMKQANEGEGLHSAGRRDTTVERLARLKQELAQLRTSFTEKYPSVVKLKTEIATLEAQLARAAANGHASEDEAAPVTPSVLEFRRAVSEVETEIKALKAEEDRLRRDIVVYQRRVENAPQREQEFQETSRDYDTTKELYHSLLKRYEDAQLAESLEQRQKGEQFRILDPAIPKGPVAPDRLRLILMGLMLSLGLAFGVVVLAEQLDTSFHSVDDLRSFSRAPVLVSLPLIVTATDVRRRRWRLGLGAAAAIVVVALAYGLAYLVATGEAPLLGESVQARLLRTD